MSNNDFHDDGMQPGRRRLVPLAAAAVAVVVGGVACVSRPGDETALPATSPSVSAPTNSSAADGTSASPAPTSTPTTQQPTGPGRPGQAALPVYVIGATGSDKGQVALYRRWVSPPAGTGTDAEARVAAAVALSLAAPPEPDGAPQPWSGATVRSVDVEPARITVTLASGGQAVGSDRYRQLALQEIVWTAQAAVGKGDLPVRVVTADGSQILGRHASGLVAQRDPAWEVLGPIWILSPADNTPAAAAKGWTVTGEASVYEGALEWSIGWEGDIVRSGRVTASEGGPGRGTFRFTTGPVPPGRYVIRVWAADAESGGVAAEETVTVGTVETPGVSSTG